MSTFGILYPAIADILNDNLMALIFFKEINPIALLLFIVKLNHPEF
jgi:hypothetical protein